MKVVIATSSYPLNPTDSAAAAGLFVRDFALEMADQGHSVIILTQERSGFHQDDPELRVVRYDWAGDRALSTLRLSHPKDLLAMTSVVAKGLLSMNALLKQERPDLVLAMWAIPAGLLASLCTRNNNIPYRVWTLGSDIWTYGQIPVLRQIVRGVLRRSQKTFADGLQLADATRALSGREVEFLPSCRRLPEAAERPEILDPQKDNFVFIGRFHPNKGIDLLVEAIAALERQHSQASHFLLFGGGPMESQIRDRIEELNLGDRVSLMGYADRVQASTFLTNCRALIIPSRIESIPVVLSDAAQAGCPLLVTDVGDMRGLVERHSAGIVVSPEVQSLKAGIEKMSATAREDYRTGLDALRKEFDLVRSVERALE